MIKRTLLLFMLLLFTACGTRHVEKMKFDNTHMPLWAFISFKKAYITYVSAGIDEIRYEDKRYMYSIHFERVMKGPYSLSNLLFDECEYQGATFTVVDKEAQKIVVEELYVEQRSCLKCHNR